VFNTRSRVNDRSMEMGKTECIQKTTPCVLNFFQPCNASAAHAAAAAATAAAFATAAAAAAASAAACACNEGAPTIPPAPVVGCLFSVLLISPRCPLSAVAGIQDCKNFAAY
jgi:hypothetical protein